MLSINKVYQGDCLNIMKDIDDESIDMIITSPPYDNLRCYNGYSFDFDAVAQSLYRVIKVGGVVVWIVNDSTIKGSESGTSFRQALYFKSIGFNIHDTMIWHKVNPIPQLLEQNKRYQPEFEFMFAFSKGKPKTFNPILVDCVSSGKIRQTHNSKFKKINCAATRAAEYRVTKDKKIHGNIFSTPTSNTKFNHPAIFPVKLIVDQINTWSNKNELIYDPFMGSGTTAVACINTNRNYIGSEISSDYIDVINKRIAEHTKQLSLDI